jgi:hypothetical protein
VDVWSGGLIDTLGAFAARAGLPGLSPDIVLIEAVRSTVAREIDPLLPSMSFDAWLHGELGSQVQPQWEINDCGEQTGNPAMDRDRQFPKCAELRAKLPGRGTLILALAAGSEQKQPVGVPKYRFGFLDPPDGNRVVVYRLADVASVIKAR